jgi:uncharacterized protein YbaR (Trm112 family)
MFKEILDILACPKCKGDLIYKEEFFICKECRLLFPIEDDIPNFIVEEAVLLDDEKLNKLLKDVEND